MTSTTNSLGGNGTGNIFLSVMISMILISVSMMYYDVVELLASPAEVFLKSVPINIPDNI